MRLTAVREVEARLGEALAPFQAAIDRLLTIPAVGRTVARVIVAEIGFDMSRFPTAGHLVSWAGLCPRQQESAGKRLSTRTRPGNPWLKTTLVQVAWVAARTRNTYPAGAVSPSQEPARTQEGDSRRCRLHADDGVLAT